MLASGQVPQKISASGYQNLIDCPYRFFSFSVLRLRETDDVLEEMDKRELGEFVHVILIRFHQRFPQLSGVDLSASRDALLEESRDAIAAVQVLHYFDM